MVCDGILRDSICWQKLAHKEWHAAGGTVECEWYSAQKQLLRKTRVRGQKASRVARLPPCVADTCPEIKPPRKRAFSVVKP